MIAALASFLITHAYAGAEPVITLHPGYVSKVRCEGRLLISAIGEASLVALEALPANIGCGVILKPLVKSGRTNLILETSTGSLSVLVEITQTAGRVESSHLEVKVKARE